MLPYGHLVTGALAAAALHHKKNPQLELLTAIQAAGAVGGIIPDLPTFWNCFVNLALGLSLFEPKGSVLQICDNFLHTLLVWIVVVAIIKKFVPSGWAQTLLLAVAVGAISHILGDAVTHKNHPEPKCYFYPLPCLPEWFGLWGYYPPRKRFWLPVWQEWVVTCLCAYGLMIQLVRAFDSRPKQIQPQAAILDR